MNSIASWIRTWDIQVLFFIEQHMRTPLLDAAMVCFSTIGNVGILWIVIGLLLLVRKRSRRIGIMLLTTLAFNAILGEGIIKNLFHRPRPFDAFPDITMIISRASTYSFPSGHTASSFASAYVLAKYYKKYAVIWWLVAGLIGFSRMYLFQHYPTDVLGGIVLGLFSAWFVTNVLETHYKNRIKVMMPKESSEWERNERKKM